MPLKDLNAAGAFGAGLASLGVTLNSLANQYASGQAPLVTLLASVGLSASITDNDATRAAVAALAAAVQLPSDAAYATATAGRFTPADIADANAVLRAVLVAAYVVASQQATLPLNDLQ